MSLIFGIEEWIIHYRQDKHAIWISAHLDNGERVYIKQNENGSLITWKKIADYCSDNGYNIEGVTLQYRSHEVYTDTSDAEAVYLSKSVVGVMGSDESKDCFCLGILKDGFVEKSMYVAPELVVQITTVDKVEDCIEEALIYNDKKQDRQK